MNTTPILRPNEQRGNLAKALLWTMACILGVEMIIEVWLFFIYPSSEYPGYELESSVMNLAMALFAVGIIQILAFILSAVFFISWFRRGYYNIGQLAGRMEQTDGWASGAWFVPILNLFRPYQMMREMYLKTGRFLKSRQMLPESFTMRFLGVWWGFWVTGNILSRIAQRISNEVDTLDGLKASFLFDAFCTLITFIAALLAIKVVKTYMLAEPILLDSSTTSGNPLDGPANIQQPRENPLG